MRKILKYLAWGLTIAVAVAVAIPVITTLYSFFTSESAREGNQLLAYCDRIVSGSRFDAFLDAAEKSGYIVVDSANPRGGKPPKDATQVVRREIAAGEAHRESTQPIDGRTLHAAAVAVQGDLGGRYLCIVRHDGTTIFQKTSRFYD